MPKATSHNAKATKRDVLSLPAIKKRVAQQRVWCIINRRTGEVIGSEVSRAEARAKARIHWSIPTTIVYAELRVAGQRA